MELKSSVVIVIVVLLFALICVVFLDSAMRCVVQRRVRERNARAMFLARQGDGSEHGLDDKTLATLPVLTFKVDENSKRMGVDCAICLSEFNENDRLRFLPKCNHVFHLDCIDMWLMSHTSCPVCRDPIKPDGDDAPSAPTVDQATESGGTIFLTRDHQGNASARISTAVEIVEVMKDEISDVRPELVRDTSWNSLSEARYAGSRKLSREGSREGSLDRLGSLGRSFRAQLVAILSSDMLSTPVQHQASTSSLPSIAPVSSIRRSSSAPSFTRSSSAKSSSGLPSTESGLPAQDQLRASGQISIEMN